MLTIVQSIHYELNSHCTLAAVNHQTKYRCTSNNQWFFLHEFPTWFRHLPWLTTQTG